MHQNRRFDRKTFRLPGQIELTETGDTFDCHVIDLSPGGAKIELNKTLVEGSALALTIGNLGAYPANVVWVKRPHIGLKFARDPDEMAEVILALATYA